MIYIRVDANELIGTGHVMRCLALAGEARRQGLDVTFIVANQTSKKVIVANDFSVICLDSAWDRMEEEVDELLDVIREKQIKLLIVDSYYVTEAYFHALRPFVKLVYIDDLYEAVYPVDMLINYNLYARDLPYRQSYQQHTFDTRFLLGTGYAPLRQEFATVQRSLRESVSKVLITSGGTDPYNVIGHILDQLQHCEAFLQTHYYVILGRYNNYQLELEEKWNEYANIHFMYNVSNMSEYMLSCDIAIAAGGTTFYELCACGLPTIMYMLADNQLQMTQVAKRQQIAFTIGDVRKDMKQCMDYLQEVYLLLTQNPNLRLSVSKKMQEQVDGVGSERIVTELRKLLKL